MADAKKPKRSWFWAECEQCPTLWRSAAVQDRAKAVAAAAKHNEGRPGHSAEVVNPADG